MDNPPIQDPNILEAMEACRPGSDDRLDPALAFLAAKMEGDPELRELYTRLQRVDSALVDAFHDVPVPDGLAERIMQRLAAARRGPVASAVEAAAGQTATEEPAAAATSRRRERVSRRWLLAGVGVVSTVLAASVLVAVFFPWPEPETYTKSQVWELAIEFSAGEADVVGELVTVAQPPGDYPFSPDVSQQIPGIRWRRIEGFLGRQGVAYDMLGEGGAAATLYVVKYSVPDLPSLPPPLGPSLETGGRSAAAWQSGESRELLYVLVVHGGPRAYRGFLPPPGPWT